MSQNNHHRDWRGFFALSGLTQLEYGVISQCKDKTEKLLKLWIDKNTEKGIKTSIHHLMTILATIDRSDVVEDISLCLGKC